MTAIYEAQNVQQTRPAAAPPKKAKTVGQPPKQPLGAGERTNFSTNGMPKLTPILYEIKDGDSLMKIANELGLNVADVVDQLKASGKLPDDYDITARHKKDISWMKKGNKIKLSYPETDKQKADYEAFVTKRRQDFYNKKAELQRKIKAEKEAADLEKLRKEYDALPAVSKFFTKRP